MRMRLQVGPGRERGVALLAAIVIVAIATVLAAAIAFDTGLAARRAAGGLALDQAISVAQAAEGLAAYAIVQERGASQTLHGAQNWAKPIGPVEVAPGVLMTAQLEDLQGRFNLNRLVDAEGKKNEKALEVFARLLESLGIDGNWGPSIIDWIDPDNTTEPAGAEDAIYLGLAPGYRTPNRAITTPSELLALKDFGLERWQKLAPFVTALPRDAPLNLCSVSAPLLDALTGEEVWAPNPEALARSRATRCFPEDATLRNEIGDTQQYAALQKELGIAATSGWFSLRTLVQTDAAEFALYSLLHYEGAGGNARVRVVQRGFAE